MELDNTRTSPNSPIPTNRQNMAQVDQSEIYDLVLDSDIQQYMDIAFCSLLVYDICKYSTRIHHFTISYLLKD